MEGLTILPERYRVILERLVDVCGADERVRAVFVVGSYARGTADEHSDLDFYLITADEGYKEFVADKGAFVRRLGEALFVEDFEIANFIFAIFAGGEEVEIGIGRESAHGLTESEPYRVLLDKRNSDEGGFGVSDFEAGDEVEMVRRQIYWFWHDLSHFVTAMARGQLWWGYGQLEALRRYCVNLVRLKYDLADGEVGDEPYFKVEKVVPVDVLVALGNSCVPMDRGKMVRAVWVIVRFYQEVAKDLADRYGIRYPVELEGVMVGRLEVLGMMS